MRRLVAFVAALPLAAACSGDSARGGDLAPGAATSGRAEVAGSLVPPTVYGWSSGPLGILTTGFSSLRHLFGLAPERVESERIRIELADGTIVGGLLFAWEQARQAPLVIASFGFLQDRWGTEAAKFHELYVEDHRHRLPAHVLILDHPSSGPFLANNDLLSVGSYDDAQMWIEIASVLRDNPEVESIHLFGVSMSGQTVVHALIEDARRGLSLFSSGMAVSIAPDTQQAPGRQLARLATTEGVTNPWRALAPGAHEHSGDGIQAQTVRLLLSRQFVPGYRRLRPEDEDFEIPSESIPTFLWRAFEDRLGFLRRSRRLYWNHDFTLESLPAFLRTTRIEAVVDRVRTPLLLLSAEDDPAVRRESFREVVDAASSNPWILAYEAERGGHFGFDMAYGRGYLGELLRLMIDPTLMQSWNAEPGGQASRSRGRLTP